MSGERIRVMMDHQMFQKQRFGGISRYFYELASRMQGVDTQIALKYSVCQYLKKHDVAQFTAPPTLIYKWFKHNFKKANLRHVTPILERRDYDIFHPTYYDPYFLPLIGDRPFVLTIHDMTHERFPQYYAGDPTPGLKRLLAEKAARIIAISENTKRDIVELLGVSEEKIDVIYHGLEPHKVPFTGCHKLGLPKQYILYVGERRNYKNFDLTLQAFSQIRHKYPDLKLILTGKHLSGSERRRLAELGISADVICKSDVSDLCLSQLYRHARFFVYPSLYEGFGIPILEAFAQDCPVVLANASCFPEVAGEAAAYFDPCSLEEFVEAMLSVLDSEERRQQLIAKGRERLPLFTWNTTASKTVETYRKVLG